MTENYGLPSRYQNIQLVGTGAIGSVYKATDAQSGNLIAIKNINRVNAGFAESLENEFSILSTLSHPNLIKVYDYGISESGSPYFTMDYIHGPNLREYLSNSEGIAHTSSILMSILSALDYLSERNIVHGDIKPENIMITGKTKSTPILVDFGLSALSRLDQSRIFGTPRFIAPEIFKAQQYSPKSDIYALGHTIIECITGSTTPLVKDISEEYYKEAYECISEAFSLADIPYARTLTSFILELSDPDLTNRPDSIAIALQKLSMVSSTTSQDKIVIEYSHIPRNHVDAELSNFLGDTTSSKNVLLIDGSIGTRKEVLLANTISKAQLSNYIVLNFSALLSDRLSIQDIVNILAINLSPSESKHLTTRHRDLISNLKIAEASGDLDNLGVIYSNVAESILSLSSNRPVLLVIQDIDTLSSDFLKFLMYLVNLVGSREDTVKILLSYTPDIPLPNEIINLITKLSERAIKLHIGGFDIDELGSLCRNIFKEDLFTTDELSRIITLTDGIPQFILDYLNFLLINQVITRIDRTFYVDHKLLNDEYSNNKYDDIANDVLSRLGSDDIFFLTTLSLSNAPVNIDIIHNIIPFDISDVIKNCEEFRLLELNDNFVSLKSVFLKSTLGNNIDHNTRRQIHQILAEYTLIYSPSDYANIADHFINANSITKAYEYGIEAVSNLESSHQYYSAYRMLLSLRDLIERQNANNLKINILEKLSSLELTLGYIDDSETDYKELIDISSNTESTAYYYSRLGYIEHAYKGNQALAIDYYDLALDLARQHNNRKVESTILTAKGVALSNVAFIDQAAEIAGALHPREHIRALSNALYYHTTAGNTERCTEILSILDNYLSSGDLEIAFGIFHAKYINAFYSSKYDIADQMLQQLISISNQSCDERAHIQFLSSLAGTHYIRGQFDKQIAVLTDALNIINKYQLHSRLVIITSNLALAYISIAKYSEAVELIYECKKNSADHSITEMPTYYYSIGARSFMYLGNLFRDNFHDFLTELEKAAKEANNQISLGHMNLRYGDNSYFNRDFEDSEKHYASALEIFRGAEAKDDMLEALLRLSLAHRYIGDHGNARDYAKQAAKIFREINCGYLKPLYSYVAALSEVHDNPDSLAPMLEAIDTSKAFGTREWTWQIQFHLARLYKEAGDISNSVKYCRESINTLKEITESFDNPEQISSYLQVPLRSQVFDFVKSLRP